jgi:hypothetical protein
MHIDWRVLRPDHGRVHRGGCPLLEWQLVRGGHLRAMNDTKDEKDEPVTFELSNEELEKLATQRSVVVRNVTFEPGKTPYTIENAPVSKMVRPRDFKKPSPIQ